MKKKSGGQPGNRNAVKHGFYATSFSRPEQNHLSTDVDGEYKDEIALMRVLIGRTAKAMKDGEGMTWEDQLSALRTVTLAVSTVSNMLRAKEVVFAGKTSFEEAMEELKEIDAEED